MPKFNFLSSTLSKWIFIASCCFAFGGVIFLISGALIAIPAHSNLVVNEKKYDFGEVEPEEQISHGFLVRNNGKSEVFIKEIKTSCGCTEISFKTNEIEPGQEEKITLKYDAPRLSGKISHWAVLSTEPPSVDKIILHLNATVVERFSVNPRILNFGIIDRKLLPATQKIKVFIDETQDNIDVSSFKALSDNENVDLAVSKVENGYWVSAKISNNIPYGNLFGNLKFSLKGKKPISIPKMGKVIGDFYATPNEMDWGKITFNDSIEKKIKITCRQKNVATISADVVGDIKDLMNIEIESLQQNEINLIASLKNQPHFDSRVDVFGIIKVTIVDQLHGKYELNIPITAFIESDKDYLSTTSEKPIMTNKSGN